MMSGGAEPTKLFQDEFLEIVYDRPNQWLYADWRGYQTDKSVKNGINSLINLIAEHQVFKVLNDNTNTLGIWMGVASWLVFDALPRARSAGMTSFAHVHGTSRFSRISAEAALLLLGPAAADIRAFDDIDEAMHWLRLRP